MNDRASCYYNCRIQIVRAGGGDGGVVIEGEGCGKEGGVGREGEAVACG